MALRMAKIATPTSANTAIHMFAMPTAASTSTESFTPKANTMFCHTIPMVLRDRRIALAIFDGLSSMSTISAASMAASEPIAPIAIPISARVSTGASLMPSPTKASLPFLLSSSSKRSTSATLSWGRSLAWNSSRPSFEATERATSSASPVNITVLVTPVACRSAMVLAASSFTMSAITI